MNTWVDAFPFGVRRPQADQVLQATSCALKAQRFARIVEILRESWMEFTNCSQGLAVAGF